MPKTIFVGIVFPANGGSWSKTYVYMTTNPNLQVKDTVVVESGDAFSVVVVSKTHDMLTAAEKAKAWRSIVGKVDVERANGADVENRQNGKI